MLPCVNRKYLSILVSNREAVSVVTHFSDVIAHVGILAATLQAATTANGFLPAT